MELMDKILSREFLGRKIESIRKKANLTRGDLSKLIKVPYSTLDRMEHGTAPVEFSDFINIYRACGANVQHDISELTNPEIIDNFDRIVSGDMSLPSDKPGYDEKWESAYNTHIELSKSMTYDELTITNRIIECMYSGDRYAILNTFLAYLELGIEIRDMDCGLIADQWQEANMKGKLSPDALPVNIQYILRARDRAKKAHRNGEKKYI